MSVYTLSVLLQGAAVCTGIPSAPKQGIDIIPSVAQIQADLNLMPDASVYGQVLTIFGSYNDKERIYPRLQDLYTRRQICWNLMMSVWDVTDYVQSGVDDKVGQQSMHFKDMHKAYDEEIIRLEERASATLSPVGGVMRALPPVSRRPGMLGQPWPGGPYGPWRRPFGG